MTALELNILKAARGRIDAIDELKGVAILLIILYHAGGVLVWQNTLHGDLGVDLFVLISGIGLAISSRVETPAAFLRRRLVRVFPAYWIVLTLFLLANTHYLQHRYTFLNVILHYLGIHAWFGDFFAFSIDDSFWFITLIVCLYLLYAFLRPALTRADHIVLVGGTISFAVAYAYLLAGQGACFSHLGLRLPAFFAGLIIGALLRDGHVEIRLSPALAAGLVMLTYVPYTRGFMFHSEIPACALAMAYVFLWREMAPAVIAGPTSRFLGIFGKYSLEIFLLHQPLIREYNYYLHARLLNEGHPSVSSLIIGMFLGLCVTVILSVELHKLLDRIGAYLAGARETR